METLQIQNLYYKYPDSTHYIYEDLNIEIHKGWSSIVGANGCGKTTLLKLITKELNPEDGSIVGNQLVYFCPQSTENEPRDLEEFQNTFNSKTFKIRNLLGIEDDWLYRWQSLSHGERKRIQIAMALFYESDVLVVDEPTNHLDITTKERVYQALKTYKGIGIIVSHDRRLLDTLCGHTILIKNSNVSATKANYTTTIQEQKKRQTAIRSQEKRDKLEIKKLQKTIEATEKKVAQSKKRLSKRAIDKNDRDTKEKNNLAKLTGKDKKDGQLIKSLESRKEKVVSNLSKPEKEYEKGIFLQNKNKKNIFPFSFEKTILNITPDLKYTIPRLTIENGDKIWIKGENGSGKSTFLNHLISKLTNDEYLYIPQEITEQKGRAIFQEILDLSNEKRGEIFTIITRLSSDPKALIQSKSPSPGEIRKLLIALNISKNPSMIILDEPTNHMDLDSILAIENALKEYDGVVVFVSHDEVFSKELANRVWECEKADPHHLILLSLF